MNNDEDIEDKIKLEEQRLARILNKKRGPFPTNKRWSGGFFNSPLQKTSSQDEGLSSSTKSKNNSATTTRSRHDSNTNISPTSSPSEPEIKQIVRSQSISEPPKIHSTSSFKSSFLKNELNDSQEQEFIMWANEYLDSSLQVETLIDFTDGVRLIELLQTLTGKRVGRYSRTPKLVSQKIDNVNVAIDFMEKELKIKLLAFNQRAYVDGNRSMILGVLFNISNKFKGTLQSKPNRNKVNIHGDIRPQYETKPKDESSQTPTKTQTTTKIGQTPTQSNASPQTPTTVQSNNQVASINKPIQKDDTITVDKETEVISSSVGNKSVIQISEETKVTRTTVSLQNRWKEKYDTLYTQHQTLLSEYEALSKKYKELEGKCNQLQQQQQEKDQFTAVKKKISLQLSCSNLPNMDIFSRSDPFIIVFKQEESEDWTEIGRTEVIQNNLDPEFQTLISFSYSSGSSLMLKFLVLDSDKFNIPIFHDMNETLANTILPLEDILQNRSLKQFVRYEKSSGKDTTINIRIVE